eukprot:SAG31_NODE_1494_length_8106_cov_7.933183_10_plen_143_part_00
MRKGCPLAPYPAYDSVKQDFLWQEPFKHMRLPVSPLLGLGGETLVASILKNRIIDSSDTAPPARARRGTPARARGHALMMMMYEYVKLMIIMQYTGIMYCCILYRTRACTCSPRRAPRAPRCGRQQASLGLASSPPGPSRDS